MKKIYWIFLSLLLIAYICSHFRSAAAEYHLTNSIWIQVTTANGGVRLIVLRGDPSATWMSGIVIERDKATWRYSLESSSFGYRHYFSTADVEGTPIDTLRFDLPLLPVLSALSGLAILIAVLKRWGAPPHLIWEECWRSHDGHVVVRRFRTAMLVSLTILATISTGLWIGHRAGFIHGLNYYGDSFAFVTAKRSNRFGFQIPGGSSLTVAERVDQIVAEEEARLEWRRHHFSIEVMPSQFAFRYFNGRSWPEPDDVRTHMEFAQFSFTQEPAAAPIVETLIPPQWFVRKGIQKGLERTVSIPSWALVLLLSVWPLWRFVRGPLRRARNRSTGCCRRCGYSLTGLTLPRCPECGNAVEANHLIGEIQSERDVDFSQVLGRPTVVVEGDSKSKHESLSREL